MSKYDDHYSVKIESGQTINPESFPQATELVCIQAPSILDQLAIRKHLTRNIALSPGLGVYRPVFTLEGVNNFNITEVRVISKTDLIKKSSLKRLELLVSIEYNLLYSDGTNQLIQPDNAIFNLTINKIFCPDYRIKCFPKEYSATSTGVNDNSELIIEVEAIAKAFGEVICPCTGALILEIGAFFIVKSECISQLLIPSYGYCSTHLEQERSGENVSPQ